MPDTGPRHDPERAHLFIVLNDPCENRRNLIVSISRYHDRCDTTCLLEGGHHFIREKSFVLYAKTKDVATEELCQNVRDGRVEYRGPLAETEFKLVFDGILKSRHTPPRAKMYFRHFCL
jgi:hypothetical protein